MSLVDEIGKTLRQKLGLEEVLFYAQIPVDNHMVKKNRRPIFRNRSTGKSFIGKSKSLKGAENHMLLELRSLKNKYGIIKPFEGALWVMLLFKSKDLYTARRSISRGIGDLSNLLELPCDCLQESGIIDNDSQIHSFDLSRRIEWPENILEIFIMRFKEDISLDL